MPVYFIQNEKGNINISSEEDPHLRLSKLSTGSDEKLKVIGKKLGSYNKERNIYKKFSDAHINREWFKPIPKLLEYINSDQEDEQINSDNLIIRDLQERIDYLEKIVLADDKKYRILNNDDFIENEIKRGIEIATKNNVRPSVKILKNRKKTLNELPTIKIMEYIDKLIMSGEIIIDNTGRVPVFFLPPTCGW